MPPDTTRDSAGGSTDDQHKPRERRRHPSVAEVVELECGARERVERRQQYLHQRHREQHRKGDIQNRLAEELRDQLPACRAERLAHPNLTRALRCARGREVREIHAGNQEDRERDDAKARMFVMLPCGVSSATRPFRWMSVSGVATSSTIRRLDADDAQRNRQSGSRPTRSARRDSSERTYGSSRSSNYLHSQSQDISARIERCDGRRAKMRIAR